MKQPRRIFALTIFFILVAGALSAQNKFAIKGIVRDSLTDDLLPLVSIQLNGPTQSGVNSNLDGEFALMASPGKNYLIVKYSGYKYFVDSVTITDHDVEGVVIRLNPVSIGIATLIIGSDYNPAIRIVKNTIRNKRVNRLEQVDAYQYESYNKLVISMDNVTDQFLSNKLIRGVGDAIKDAMADSLQSDTSKYKLAVFVSESVSEFFFLKPGMKKEEIMAVQTSGVKGTEYNLLSSMILQIDINTNVIDILNKQFVSPVADGALVDYDFRIASTDANGNDTLWGIDIIPRHPWDPVFAGRMYIDNHDWAINRIELKMNKNPNINFVEDVRIQQEFAKVEGYWVPVLLDLQVDFQNSVLKRTGGDGIGLIGRTSCYLYNYKLNQPRDIKFYQQEMLEVLEGAESKDSTFWAERRRSPLDQAESAGFDMVNSLKSRGVLDFYINAVKFITWGTKEFKYFEIGPYFYVVGFNQAEGFRTRLGIYTLDNFSKRLYIGGHLAYGFRDHRLKYMAEARYRLVKKPKLEVGAKRTYEVEQVGFHNFLDNGTSLLQTMLRRVPLTQLNYYTENKIYFNSDLRKGLSATLWTRTKLFEPASTFDFGFRGDMDQRVTDYRITEAGILFRISFKEKYITSGGDKLYIGTRFPIINAGYTRGFDNLLGGQFNYDFLTLNLNGKVKLGRFGFAWYWINSGKIFGTLPYPSLHVFRGNQTWGYDYEGFNLMNYYEFVADQYLTVSIDHHLEGLIWNKLPILRRFKWKEVFTARLAWGSLTPQNKLMNTVAIPRNDGSIFQQTIDAPTQGPYLEAGVGLENIFKFIRIDGIWRLNYHDINPVGGKSNWGARNNFGMRVALFVRF
jgi:Family of unknown function (DUF5686)/CarboxypepD_reg-like domain